MFEWNNGIMEEWNIEKNGKKGREILIFHCSNIPKADYFEALLLKIKLLNGK